MRKIIGGLLLASALILISVGVGWGAANESASSLCLRLDEKPVLSLNTINQAQLVHLMIELNPNLSHPTGVDPQSDAYYEAEVQTLIDAGYPPIFAGVESDHIVTRRYFASLMFEIASETDPAFRAKYGELTDETERTNALVQSDWLFDGEDPNIYYEEILSVLCNKSAPPPPRMAVDIIPASIRNAELEGPRSPL
jgi:hypothetical protein